jgi:hypothetical protein
MEDIYDLINDEDSKIDKTFQREIIDMLKGIENVEKADTFYERGNPETGLLSTLSHHGMVDVINYLVNRKDVSSKYIDDGFVWACRRVETGPIFAILDSGNVSMNGLQKGIKELNIEGAGDIVSKILKKVSLKILKRVENKKKTVTKMMTAGKKYSNKTRKSYKKKSDKGRK